MIVISSTATFDEFDFPNCPREKLPNKPPPKNQSPETNDWKDTNQGADNGLQSPDHNQPDHQSPQRPDPGLLGSDTKDSNDDLYGPPRPSKHTGSKSTEENQQSPPAPVPPKVPIPPQPNFPQPPKCTNPSMSYQKDHPRAPMKPQVHPIRTIKPVIQKDSIYGNWTPIQIKKQIRTEQDFIWKILRQGYQDHRILYHCKIYRS